MTHAELRELQNYEAMTDTRPPQPVAAAKKTEASKPPTAVAVRRAALESASLAEAEQTLRAENLATMLQENKRLRQAWEKGRRLRDIRDMAATPISLEDASVHLGFGDKGLQRLYDRDAEVRDVWDRGRVALKIKVQDALLRTASRPETIAEIEKILHGRLGRTGGPPIDFTRLTPTQMAEATDFPRQTILRWYKKNGLPRNADGTYNLPTFIAWYLKWERDKLTGGREAAGLNPLQAEKARREKRENDEAEGRLVPLALHSEALQARAHALASLLSPFRAHEWAQSFTGKRDEDREREILAAFTVVKEVYQRLSPDIPLSEEARGKFEEALVFTMKERS